MTKTFYKKLIITLFWASLIPISPTAIGLDVSLETLLAPIIIILLTLAIFDFKPFSKYLDVKINLPQVIVFLILLSYVTVFFILRQDETSRAFNLGVFINLTLGFILYIYYRASDAYNVGTFSLIIWPLIGVSYILYHGFSGGVAVNKHVLASMSINPNGIINALVIYVLIALMFAQNVTKWKYTVWTLIWTTSAAFFSRQNFISMTGALLVQLRRDFGFKSLILFLPPVLLVFFSYQGTRILEYLWKGFSILLGNIESTRFEWINAALENISINPFFPDFSYPIDNTALSIFLQFGLIGFILVLVPSLIIFWRILKVSPVLLFSFLVLLILQDLHFEASFWFIFFSLMHGKWKHWKLDLESSA